MSTISSVVNRIKMLSNELVAARHNNDEELAMDLEAQIEDLQDELGWLSYPSCDDTEY